jgi:hypothetical protein
MNAADCKNDEIPMKLLVQSILAVSLAWVWACCATTAADNDGQKSSRSEAARKLVDQEAQAYEITVDVDSKGQAHLKKGSLLHWSNPVSGELYGDVYLWTRNGRPEAIASIYKWYSPHRHMSVEFHSLALRPLTARRNGQAVWNPASAGVQLHVVPKADPPADGRRRRLRQLKSMAVRFAARATARDDPDEHEQLRLLRNPVYRYQLPAAAPSSGSAGSPADTLIDGALFAFVQGTNPEVILLLEARKTADGGQWQYALARQNSVRLQVTCDGEVVWDVPQIAPPWGNVRRPAEPYILLRIDETTER